MVFTGAFPLGPAAVTAPPGLQNRLNPGSAPVDVQEHADEFRQASRLRLLHHIRAVDLDRPWTDAHLISNDLVGLSADQPVQNLVLARAKRREARLHLLSVRSAYPRAFAEIERLANCADQIVRAKRLFKQ